MKVGTQITKAGRALTPHLARTILRRPLIKPLALLETYIAYIQGKGAGGGWDIVGEASVAVPFIRRNDAIVFDVGAHHGE